MNIDFQTSNFFTALKVSNNGIDETLDADDAPEAELKKENSKDSDLYINTNDSSIFEIPEKWTHEDLKKLIGLYEKNPEALGGWENQELKEIIETYTELYNSKIVPNLENADKLTKINSILNNKTNIKYLEKLAINYNDFTEAQTRETALSLAKANEERITRRESEIIESSVDFRNISIETINEWESKTTAGYLEKQYEISEQELKDFQTSPSSENLERITQQEKILEESQETLNQGTTFHHEEIIDNTHAHSVEETSQLSNIKLDTIQEAMSKNIDERIDSLDEQIDRLNDLEQTEEVIARKEAILKAKEELEAIQEKGDYEEYLEWVKENSSDEEFEDFIDDALDGSIDKQENKKLFTDALINKTENYAEAVIELDNDIFFESTGYDSKRELYQNNQAAFESKLSSEKLQKLKSGYYDSNRNYQNNSKTDQAQEFSEKIANFKNSESNNEALNSSSYLVSSNRANEIAAKYGVDRNNIGLINAIAIGDINEINARTQDDLELQARLNREIQGNFLITKKEKTNNFINPFFGLNIV